jgi:hypothetical protein
MTTMNCKQAQRDIALWAGHDLDDPAEQEAVRRHVTTCPCCRVHYQQMKRTLRVLERAERPATYVSGDSLWPELATRIRRSRQQPSLERNIQRLGGWMPFIAMTAACFILLLVLNEQPQPSQSPILRGFSPAPLVPTEASASRSEALRLDSQSFEHGSAADERLLQEWQRRHQRERF